MDRLSLRPMGFPPAFFDLPRRVRITVVHNQDGKRPYPLINSTVMEMSGDFGVKSTKRTKHIAGKGEDRNKGSSETRKTFLWGMAEGPVAQSVEPSGNQVSLPYWPLFGLVSQHFGTRRGGTGDFLAGGNIGGRPTPQVPVALVTEGKFQTAVNAGEGLETLRCVKS
ncbi:hypothetical protein AnigIFM60653_004046 [Aspergillus niger]|nr:hypothetical protein AnigIFM60653_004046 [Aspergillus niger]